MDLLPSSQFCTYVRKWESNAGYSQNLDFHPVALIHVLSIKGVLIHEFLNVKFKGLFYFFVNNKKIDKKEIDMKRLRLKEPERTSRNRGTQRYTEVHRGTQRYTEEHIPRATQRNVTIFVSETIYTGYKISHFHEHVKMKHNTALNSRIVRLYNFVINLLTILKESFLIMS